MNIEDLLLNYESLIYSNMEKYSQFTIDFIQNAILDLPEEEEELPNCVGSYSYQVENVLEIITDGLDKYLFTDLLKEIHEL